VKQRQACKMTHLLKYTLKTTAEPPRLWKKTPSESFHHPVQRSGALLTRKKVPLIICSGISATSWCTEPASKWALHLFALLSFSSAICKSLVQLKKKEQTENAQVPGDKSMGNSICWLQNHRMVGVGRDFCG